MELNSAELAWAAGFFDGEGSTSLSTPAAGKSRLPRITITQREPECLQRFQRAVGCGSIYGPLKNYNIHIFSIQNVKGIDSTLNKLWPFLSTPKREQATRAGFCFGVVRVAAIGRPKGSKNRQPRVANKRAA